MSSSPLATHAAVLTLAYSTQGLHRSRRAASPSNGSATGRSHRERGPESSSPASRVRRSRLRLRRRTAHDALYRLIGDDEAQNIFRNDLRAAAAAGPDAPGRRSWQSPLVNVSNELGVTPSSQRGSSGSQKRQRLSPNADSRGDSIALPTPGYSNGFSFDGSLGLSMEGSSSDSEGENPAFPTQQSTSFSPSLGGIPVPPSPQRPRGLVHLQAPPKPSEIASPNIFAHQPLPSPGGPIPATIPHTGYAPATGDGPPTQLSELADVVGQLSLNEGGEIRYHGRSSGLYLISESQRYRDFFWCASWSCVAPRLLELTPAQALPRCRRLASYLDILRHSQRRRDPHRSRRQERSSQSSDARQAPRCLLDLGSSKLADPLPLDLHATVPGRIASRRTTSFTRQRIIGPQLSASGDLCASGEVYRERGRNADAGEGMGSGR